MEPDECSPEGLVACAQRELDEELGLLVDTEALTPLGPSTFPCPGVIGERHHYFHVAVKPSDRRVPIEDGSVLEQEARIVAVPLREALDACKSGGIEDAKTELALRRLREHL